MGHIAPVRDEYHTSSLVRDFQIHVTHLNHHRLICVALCCSALQWVNMCCTVLQCVVVSRYVLQCVAVCCSALQWVNMCCSALQCVAVSWYVLQCVAVCCSVLQSVAVCCNMLLSHTRIPTDTVDFSHPYALVNWTHNTGSWRISQVFSGSWYHMSSLVRDF